MLTIANYGVGNLGSILNMCRKIGLPALLTSDPDEILKADRLLLPGVGAFDRGMSQLAASGLKEALDEAVLKRGVPVLGICLGMQLMLEASEEGDLPGLGWVKGRVRRFPNMTDEDGRELKIPHMGWTNVQPQGGSRMFQGWDDECRFYFVHSYYVDPANQEHASGMAHYGIDFCCALEVNNIWATQFHPEKSHRYGMRFLQNAFKSA